MEEIEGANWQEIEEGVSGLLGELSTKQTQIPAGYLGSSGLTNTLAVPKEITGKETEYLHLQPRDKEYWETTYESVRLLIERFKIEETDKGSAHIKITVYFHKNKKPRTMFSFGYFDYEGKVIRTHVRNGDQLWSHFEYAETYMDFLDLSLKLFRHIISEVDQTIQLWTTN